MANRKITDLFSSVNKISKNKTTSVDSTKCATGSSIETTATLPTVPNNVAQRIDRNFLCRPPKTFIFTKTKDGDRNRSCQHQWFEQFPWLLYDTK